MECNRGMFALLCEAFPKIDPRIIKATALEHGDDADSAFIFLNSLNDDDDKQEGALPVTSEVEESCRKPTLEHNGFTEHKTSIAAPELSSSVGQIDLSSLEEIVGEAKSDKEVVLNLVKDVSDLRGKADLERAAAVRAKSEAAISGESLLRKAEELRKQIAQKKLDNLLRMGEIYGERAVLATEARGLKLRLEQVKLQKDRAVTTLHEIRVMLQRCYEEAVEERLLAEEDGRVKEKLAQDILAAEEALMISIEEESRKLDMEAEACSQLKEFLSHHGSIIDSLQGEMCVLCEDAQSFKGQVDNGMWSSISTESFPANLNPEGPYIFRTCKTSHTFSSQELGKSFEALDSSEHRMHASLSQDIAGCVVEQSNSPRQGNERDFQQQLNFEEDGGWHERLANSGSSLSTSDAVTSNVVYCDSHGAFENRDSHCFDNRDSYTSNEMNCDWHQNLMNSESLFGVVREAMSSHLTDGTVRSDSQRLHSLVDSSQMSNKLLSPSGSHSNRSCASSSGSLDGFTDPSSHSHFTAERLIFPIAPHAGDGWVFTPNQMEESKSSSSSSLVKIEAEDYHSC
ncbi:hypothetical protein L7F22_004915 [Adiantum nelumboides]|nr:hypothetical protein [Adiantum nelumboides]